MPSPEERLAAVETQVQDNTQALVDIRDTIGRLEHRFDGLERRLDGLEHRFDALERRFNALEARFDVLERRFDGMERRFDRLFMWTVSIQITVLIAVVSAFAAMLGVVLTRV